MRRTSVRSFRGSVSTVYGVLEEADKEAAARKADVAEMFPEKSDQEKQKKEKLSQIHKLPVPALEEGEEGEEKEGKTTEATESTPPVTPVREKPKKSNFQKDVTDVKPLSAREKLFLLQVGLKES